MPLLSQCIKKSKSEDFVFLKGLNKNEVNIKFDLCVRTHTVFIIRAEGTPKYFFTIHYYLLLAKIDLKRIVKSEELIVKK